LFNRYKSNRGISFKPIMICVLILLVIAFLLLLLCYCFSTASLTLAIVGGGLGVTGIILFIRYIYLPIIRYENALHFLEQTDEHFELDAYFDQYKDLETYLLANKVNVMLRQLKQSMDRQYMGNILVKQAEFEALQNQINPHFLYNTLDSIRGQALLKGAEDIADMTEALAIMFRYSINQKGSMVSLRAEIENVENYLKILQYRFKNKLNFVKKIESDEIDILDYQIPKLIIQPIVENAVFHGLETKPGTGTIFLRAYTTEKRLIVHVSDNGVGMEKSRFDAVNNNLNQEGETVEKSQFGIALANSNKRLKSFGEGYGISMNSTLGIGTEVEIVLPLMIEKTET